MLGDHRRRVRRCECDTVLPKLGSRPVTWQWADNETSLVNACLMKIVFDKVCLRLYRETGTNENGTQ